MQNPAAHPKAPNYLKSRLFEGLSSFRELEHRISALSTPNERGDAFEVFAEAYFATQKIVQAETVWPGETVPLDVLKLLALPPKDLGADGVFRDRSGKLSAYQVKYRAGRVSLTWEELGTFMGLTDQVDQRVLFTNSDDLPPVINERTRFFCIRGTDLDRLTPGDFQVINDWLQTGQFFVIPKTPLPHQAEALDAISKGLKDHDRVTAVMACATGKTLVALWLAEQMKCRRIVVLVPSLALVRQTLHEWLKETKWQALRFICVCSDPTVTKVPDELLIKQSDLDFAVTTQSIEVRKFLNNGGDDVQVIFTTYQSSRVVGEAAKGLSSFDLGIFDEAHKTAGREGTKFTFALNDDNLSMEKRLFMTATPRHYDVNCRDKEGEAKEVFSMDVPEAYGPRVYTLPFAEAAQRKIICDYKVIISVVTSNMVNDELLRHGEVILDGHVVHARQVAGQIALQKACEQHDLRKVFTFHSRVETARQFTGEGGQSIASCLPQFRMFHVSGDMSTAQREKTMKAFKEAERAIISNARCLTEGVDVPTVDMVAFMSPRKSKVDIIQATGRAMRKPDPEEVGYVKVIGFIMVPLYLETAEGETVEAAVARTEFEEIWNVVQAMKEQDEVLEDIIRQIKEEKGRVGDFRNVCLGERIEILGPKLSFDQLYRAIAINIVERIGVTWDERFGELKRYKEEHGDCNVPARWPENPQLAGWVNTQRGLERRGLLAFNRKARLQDLGFDWDPFENLWEVNFLALVSYRQAHGDCNVPTGWPENPQLGTWVARQRDAHRTGILQPERQRRLEELGFDWDPLTTAWETNFAELVRYKEVHGDCNVLRGWPENPRLAKWVALQRRLNNSGKLEPVRRKRLMALNFDWDPLATAWHSNFEELRRYKERYGNYAVPLRWQENPQLGQWIGDQRELRKDGKLEPAREELLTRIGFDWDPLATAWEAKFSELVRYKEVHGDCNVPNDWVENSALRTWVNNQRNIRRKGKLALERVRRLDEIGFNWNPLSTVWEANFSELLRYKEKHGDCNVPQSFSENPQLGTWVLGQREAKKRGTLEVTYIERLEKINFDWNPLITAWKANFSKLVSYKEQHGDCNVPQHVAKHKKLAHWVRNQRSARQLGRLELEYIRQLDDIGFNWELRSSEWETRFAELVQYKSQHGHCNVPKRQNSLGAWVVRQRKLKQRHSLEPERIRRLDKLGFDWDPLASEWEVRFSELVRCKQLHGDLNVLEHLPENTQLQGWVFLQRRLRRRCKLQPERQKRLDELGFDWDPLTTAWEENFAHLMRCIEEKAGSETSTEKLEDPQFIQWKHRQRLLKKRGRLESERITRLDKLGFDWDPLASEWEVNFSVLVCYKETHGDCNVPTGWPENPQLGTWVARQRDAHRTGILQPERQRRLEELGFDWDPLTTAWEANFSELLRYREKYGNCDVPAKWPENRTLGIWVSGLRKANKLRQLDQKRRQRLESIGFNWAPIAMTWEINFAGLVEYKRKHGNCNVSYRSPRYPELGQWAARQRTLRNQGKLKPEHIARLEELGFSWDPRATVWEIRFAELVRYKETHGDCNVLAVGGKNQKLRNWITTQRSMKRAGRLEPERRKRLEELGLCW